MRDDWDVVIIGAGITGLACAYFLDQLNAGRVLVVSDSASPAISPQLPGICSGGQTDYYTRIVQAHGPKIAKEVWAFGDHGFNDLRSFAKGNGLVWEEGQRFRLITSSAELREAKIAATALQDAGFSGRMQTPQECTPYLPSLGPDVLAVLNEGPLAAITDAAALHRQLLASLKTEPFSLKIDAIDTSGPTLGLWSGGELCLHSELVILANHLDCHRLLPQLRDAIVSYSDQCHFAKPVIPDWQAQAGTIFSANFGYTWGAVASDAKIVIGGSRFLRPMAGIGATQAEVFGKCRDHLQSQCRVLFGAAQSWSLDHGMAALECWPCDELPVIGPLFGDSRLLLATGYNRSGLSQGFAAGQAIAELIATGTAPALPRSLWPERLRSL